MKVFYNQSSNILEYVYELYNGKPEDHPEKPKRNDQIIKELKLNGFTLGEISVAGHDLIENVHEADYIEFLKKTSQNENQYIYPSVWPYSKYVLNKPNSLLIQAGEYVFDTFTPFTPHSWEAALNSLNLAYSATKSTIENQTSSYALCRPPGHHATKNKAGGYCLLANASICAKYCFDQGFKPAILDIDYHHGNGAQEIFYDSDEVLSVSIHRDPKEKFPYFSGDIDEIGVGKGLNHNLNLIFKKDVKIDEYLELLEIALDKIKYSNIDIIIVSAGFDTYVNDPICDGALEIKDYQSIAEKIKRLNIPVVVVQEGGYNLDDIGKCVTSFLNGLSDNAKI